MNSSPKLLRVIACSIAVVLALLVICLCNTMPLSEKMARFLVDKAENGEINYLAAQNFMWIAFFWGLAELLVRYIMLRGQQHELEDHYLPEDPRHVLTADQMPMVHEAIKARNGSGILAQMVTLLALQFQISRSAGMSQTVLSAEVEGRSNEIDLGYNILRYIAWMLPTLGFIGTVWGILCALDVAKSMPPSDELLPTVAGSMSVAFWTTLLALLMSCVIMYLMHVIQGKEETYLNKCSQYCLKNFINKLYEK